MGPYRILVVDDEPLARERLTSLLAGEPDIEVVGQCRDGEEAITSIIDHTPDLVFLDVQMPQLNGFEVIEAVGTERMPLVIFVTAYDQHALRAFQVRALDYLLKPFDRERFSEALQRARKQIERDRRGIRAASAGAVKDLRKISPAPIAWSSSPADGCSSSGPTKSTGSRRPATTCACTSGRRPTCCARP